MVYFMVILLGMKEGSLKFPSWCISHRYLFTYSLWWCFIRKRLTGSEKKLSIKIESLWEWCISLTPLNCVLPSFGEQLAPWDQFCIWWNVPVLHWGNRGKSVLNIWYASDCSSNKLNVIKNRAGPLHFNSLESSLWKSQQTVREYEDSAPQHLPGRLCQD